MELAGVSARNTGFVPVTVTYGPSSNTLQFAMVADRAHRVKSVIGRVNVAGTDAGAVTAQVWKSPSGSLVSAGALLHSGTFNLKGTAVTNQTLTLTTTDADLNIAAGDCIAVQVTGTMTSAVGAITVALTPR